MIKMFRSHSLVLVASVLILLCNHGTESQALLPMEGAEEAPSSPCNGRAPLKNEDGENFFCGRGGERCPSGFTCDIHPTDRWAVCCNQPLDSPCNLTASDCPNTNYFLDKESCECTCDIECAAIYSSRNCECCPIQGMECDPQYGDKFCDENKKISLPKGCQSEITDSNNSDTANNGPDTSEDHFIQLKSRRGGKNKYCLSVSRAYKSDGVKILSAYCNNDKQQRFRLQKDGKLQAEDGNDKCVAIDGIQKGAELKLVHCSDTLTTFSFQCNSRDKGCVIKVDDDNGDDLCIKIEDTLFTRARRVVLKKCKSNKRKYQWQKVD